MDDKRKNPLQLVIRYAVMVFLTLFFFYIALNVAIGVLQFQQANRGQGNDLSFAIDRATLLSQQVGTITSYAWNLFVPFLQLALLFLVIDWLLTRLGIDVLSKSQKLDWNIQTVIALIVVSAFSIAALAGLDGVSSLKDVALVVVGFYFGSQRKHTEIQTDKEKISITEEHEDTIASDKKQNTTQDDTTETHAPKKDS